MCRSYFLTLISLLTLHGVIHAQPGPFSYAHAHNDYEHQRPLLDAISFGFLSVEADIHLTPDNRLLVGHNGVNIQSPSLEQLYLRPLDSLLNVNNGWVYRGAPDLGSVTVAHSLPADGKQQPFYLMIDLKTEGQSTTKRLLQVLQHYPRLLVPGGPVRIILSGNVPKKELLVAEFQGLLIDGRPSDLGIGVAFERMPWISDRFSNWGTVSLDRLGRRGSITAESLNKIRQLAQRVHAEGKKLRLWAIPDQSQAWQQLLDAGVDLINSDDLAGLSGFFAEKSAH